MPRAGEVVISREAEAELRRLSAAKSARIAELEGMLKDYQDAWPAIRKVLQDARTALLLHDGENATIYEINRLLKTAT